MFSGLNEAVPLNAAEKRNAFGGSMPIEIRKLADSKFFLQRSLRKYKVQVFDLAAEFLYLKRRTASQTPKGLLDEFVRSYKISLKPKHSPSSRVREDIV